MVKRHVVYRDRPAAITPEAPMMITLKQAIVAICVLVGAGGTAALFMYTLNAQGVAIEQITKKQDALGATAIAASKEQEQKREQLGKEFLASNREIATKVGDLTTQLAVQQTQMKLTVDALSRISEQLSVIAPPARRR